MSTDKQDESPERVWITPAEASWRAFPYEGIEGVEYVRADLAAVSTTGGKATLPDDVGVSDIEANALLYALDEHYDVDDEGQVRSVMQSGLSLPSLQKLRDRLFDAHEHPEEED